MYMSTLLESFMCFCPNVSLTCLIYRKAGNRNPKVTLYLNLDIQNNPTAHQHPSFCVFQVANLACSISNNEEGVKLVRMAATQIDSLCPQVKRPEPSAIHPVFYNFLEQFYVLLTNTNLSLSHYNATYLQKLFLLHIAPFFCHN